MVITKDTLDGSTVIFRTTGTTTTEYHPEFGFSNILTWMHVYDASTYLGTLWFTESGIVYGIGFGSDDIVMAKDNYKDYIDIHLVATTPGVSFHSVYMGFNSGDGSDLEIIRAVIWDFSTLTLPLSGTGPVDETVTFIFSDFILALTRVKNEAYNAFVQAEISSSEPWTPENWSETDGLSLLIQFNDGVKLPKIESVLKSIAEELNVLIERECEFRTFLVCDSFDITASQTLLSQTTSRRSIDEQVVFMVSAGISFVPSLAVLLFSLAGLLF